MSAALRWTVRVVVPPLALFAAVLVLWHAFVVIYDVPAIELPSPARVGRAVVDNGAALATAVGLTALGAVGGFVASLGIGVLVAFAFSQSRIIQRSVWPYAVFFQTVPIVAIAPLIILWFGTGYRSVIIVAFIISVFPIITNATAGLTAVDRTLLELFELNNATRRQVLLKLRLPHSVPYLVTGAKTSAGLSVIGAIVGEFFIGFGGDLRGLGYVITFASYQVDTAYLFAAVLASTLLGLTIFGTVSLIGRLVLPRWAPQQAG